MLTSTPRITGNSGTPGSMTVGDPIILGTPNSVLIDDSGGNLGVSTPSVANTFLFWNGTNFIWTVSGSGNMAIGNPVAGGTDPSVLFIQAGLLAQDPLYFRYIPQMEFTANITDGMTYNTDFVLDPVSGTLLVNDFNTGVANILSVRTVHGGIALIGSLGIQASGVTGDYTNVRIAHDNGLITANTTYFDSGISNTYTDGSINSSINFDPSAITINFNAISSATFNNNGFDIGFVSGPPGSPVVHTKGSATEAETYFKSSGFTADIGIFATGSSGPQSTTKNIIIDQATNSIQLNHPSLIVAKVDDGAGTVATTTMSLLSTVSEWTDGTINAHSTYNSTASDLVWGNGTISSMVQASSGNALASYNDGAGTTAVLTNDATQIDLRFVNGVSESSYLHGDNASITVRLDSPSATSQSYSLFLPDSATMRWRLTTPNSPSGIFSIDNALSHSYFNFSDGTGNTSDFEASPTAATAQWTDSSNLLSNTVYSASGAFTTASNSGTGFLSTALIDPNQFVIKNDNGAGTTARALGTVFGSTIDWSNSVKQSTVSATLSQAIASFDNGLGSGSTMSVNGNRYLINHSDVNGYTGQDYADLTEANKYWTTPFQLYSDESYTYNPGDSLTCVDTGATCDVVSDDGNGIILVVNVSDPSGFPEGGQLDDGLGNTAMMTHDGGTWDGEHVIGQNITPTSTRYGGALQDVTPAGVDDRWQITHPRRVLFDTPILRSTNALFDFNKTANATANYTFTNTDAGANASIQFFFYNGATSYMNGLIGSGNTFGGLYTPNSVRFENTQGDITYIIQNTGKKHRFAVGGNATTNVKLDITNTGIDISKKVDNYNGIATVSNGMPAEYAVSDLTAQTAAIGATTIYAVPATGEGMYRISWVASVTTAATVSSSLGGTNGFQVRYTSPTDGTVKTSDPAVTGLDVSALNTTATTIDGVSVVYAKASTNIQYLFDYTSVGVTPMAYELHIKVEAM